MRTIAVFCGLALSVAQAQTFEVASVKVSGADSVRGSEGGPGSKDPGRYTFGKATLKDFIAVAYHVDYFQIVSKASLDEERFDLAAKLPGDTTREQFRIMMQNLLAERFHLKMHSESREFPGYELAIARTGFKLKEGVKVQGAGDSAEEAFPVVAEGRPGFVSRNSSSGGYLLVRMRARQEPISVLASMLQVPDRVPVVDKTGLTGKYDFTFEYTTVYAGTPDQPPVVPDLFIALQKQLGLQLISKKLPFEVVVVDGVDRLPSEN